MGVSCRTYPLSAADLLCRLMHTTFQVDNVTVALRSEQELRPHTLDCIPFNWMPSLNCQISTIGSASVL